VKQKKAAKEGAFFTMDAPLPIHTQKLFNAITMMSKDKIVTKK